MTTFKKKIRPTMWLYIGLLSILTAAIICFLFVFCRKSAIEEMTTLITKEMQIPDQQISETQLHDFVEEACLLLESLNGTNATQEDMTAVVQNLLTDSGLDETLAAEMANQITTAYLKRYDTVYSQTAGNSAINSMLSQIMDDLKTMDAYLSQLDASVTEHKLALSKLSVSQNEQYQLLQEYLNNGQISLEELKKEFSSYTEMVIEEQGDTLTGLTDIQTTLGDLSLAFSETSREFSEKLLNAENENAHRYNSVQNRISALYESAAQDMEQIDRHLERVREELKTADHDTKQKLEEMKQACSQHAQELLASVEAAQTGLEQLITDKVNLLMDELGTMQTNISSSQETITQLLTDMRSTDAQDMEKLLDRFYDVSSDLGNIQSHIQSMHEDTQLLIEEVKAGADENQEELLSVLNGIDQSFNEQETAHFQSLNESLQSQSEKIMALFESLQQSMGNNSAGILEQLGSMETSLKQDVSNITIGLTDNQTGLLNRINGLETAVGAKMDGLSNDIDSVFQRVSNGKQLLASALLTKNVVVDEDAAFREIYDAILSIEQQLVIGVDRIPGKIKYLYHYHTGSLENGRGCYTLEDVHQHVGSCYVICQVVESGCHSAGNYNVNGMMHCPKTIRHSYCWNNETRWGEWVHPDDGSSHVNGDRRSEHLVTVCGKNAGQGYGWKTGCGLNDSQIIGAEILYDADAAAASTKTVSLSQETTDCPPVLLPENRKPPTPGTDSSILEDNIPKESEIGDLSESEAEVSTETETGTETEDKTGMETEAETESNAEKNKETANPKSEAPDKKKEQEDETAPLQEQDGGDTLEENLDASGQSDTEAEIS